MPPTFTRRGERITEPTRRRQSNNGTTTDETYMSGIMSPKPVRTAAGIGRVGPAPVSDDDDDDDDDDVTVGFGCIRCCLRFARLLAFFVIAAGAGTS